MYWLHHILWFLFFEGREENIFLIDWNVPEKFVRIQMMNILKFGKKFKIVIWYINWMSLLTWSYLSLKRNFDGKFTFSWKCAGNHQRETITESTLWERSMYNQMWLNLVWHFYLYFYEVLLKRIWRCLQNVKDIFLIDIMNWSDISVCI